MDSVFFHLNPETAMFRPGPLQGLRIAIQANLSVAGWPTDAGSKALIDFTAVEDATLVQRLRQTGAFLCGSTRLSEFGFGLQGSQAGQAVHQQVAEVELVLDLMGESRLAAGRAGVCGFKPSYGLVSRFGLIGLIPSMECCGLLSADLKIIREIMKTIAGPDELDFSLPEEKAPDFSPTEIDPSQTTIGLIREAESELSAGQSEAFRSGVEELEQAGLAIRELSLPDFSLFALVHKIVGSVEASSCTGRYDSVRYGQRAPGAKNWNDMYLLSRSAAFGPLLKSYLFQGAFFQFERYRAFEDASRIRARLLADMQRLTARADFLALPVIGQAPPPDEPALLDEIYARFATTLFANVTGQPALYLPPDPGTDSAGFQLAGPRLSDSRLLALGEHLLARSQGGGS